MSPPQILYIVFVAATTTCSRKCNQEAAAEKPTKGIVQLADASSRPPSPDELGLIDCYEVNLRKSTMLQVTLLVVHSQREEEEHGQALSADHRPCGDLPRDHLETAISWIGESVTSTPLR